MSKSSSTTQFTTARRDSSPSLPNIGAQPAVPKVNVGSYDDPPLDREGIIGITVDVQNFLVAISSLKKAMEEADTVDGKCVWVCAQLSPPLEIGILIGSNSGRGKGKGEEGRGPQGGRDGSPCSVLSAII